MKLKLTPGLLCLSLLLLRPDLLPAQTHTLHCQRPAILAQLRPVGKLSSSTNLQLAIGLPLRNLPALTNLLQQIYDPASPSYRHYLTPEQFTAQFGPTTEDYQKVIAFAKAHGLKVTATHPNRLLLDVSGSVPNIEKALHVTMQVYQHPTEKRTFYAPDTEPSLDLDVPIVEISGLNNYALPHPKLQIKPMDAPSAKAASTPNSGSGINGTYMGKDFRAAYLPGVTLDGTGQTVGLLQFDGYTASDIAFYEAQAGLPNVPLQNVLLDGFSGHPTGSGGEVEVSLDIEMSVSMAPNLSKVIVYEAGPIGNWHDMLNRMANDNLAKQLSCSWFIPGGSADPLADGIFQQMALQGQSFFDASGDDDAYTGLISFAGDSPYVTQVGGTTLTTSGPGGAWVSETVWNWGNGIGSAGGISTQYAIPSWQTNVSMAANQGSTTLRNTPDVALTADNVYVRADGQNRNVGGTSCAAPLWAGFMALVNQQAITSGHPPVGFINPAVYAIGAGTQYTTTFHDITTGNNKSSSSPNKFSAFAGYDLCTGWGTPNGQNMINALANPEPLIISPVAGFTTGGGVGGPFAVTSEIFSLTNSGTNTLNWTLTSPATWLDVSPQSGTLTPGGVAVSVTVSLNTAASNLVAGIYTTAILFTNQSDGIGQSRQFALSVIAPPTITQQPTNQAVLDGLPAAFSAQVTGGLPMAFQWQVNGTNLTDNGNISGSSTTNLLIGNVSTNNVGTYALVVTNFAGAVISSNASLAIMSSPPVIVSLSATQTVYVGGSAQFSVAAVGDKPFAYQWSVNTTNIGGATNATLTLANLQLSQTGNYSVLITNLIGATNSANVLLTVNPIPSCAPVPANVVSWWSGEASAIDNIGANNGTLVNGVTFTNGEVGQAFWFNGSDYVSVPDSPSLDVFTNSITIELWMKSAIIGGNPGWMWLVDKGELSWRLEGTSGADTISFSANGVVAPSELTGTRNVNDGQWHHVAAVYDGTNKFLYIDGTLDASQAATGLIGFDSAPVEIGANAETTSAFQGALDEVTIYHRALSAAEIQLIYLTSLGGKCPAPPTITSQPSSETNYVGNTASFSVTVLGTPVSYQWSFNGANIDGATNFTLALTNLQLSQAGNYAVAITNVSGFTNSAIAALTVYPLPSCAPVPANVVSWWSGEASAIDNIGANNGTLVNGVTFTNGEVGQAFWFNGSDYVSVPDSPSLDVFTNSITIELWMKSAIIGGNPGWMWLVDKGELSWRLEGTSGADTISFSANGVVAPSELTGTRNVNDGQWHHVAAVYDGTNKFLYIDGTLDASQAATGLIGFDSAPLEIGANAETTSAFQGALDEVTIYHRALSATEIQLIYATGSSGKCPVAGPPVILTQPVGQTNFANQSVSFGVAAIGTRPLVYQWSVNTTNIAGATNASLNLSNLQVSQSGNYSVLITNSFGATNSASVVLVVNPVSSCASTPGGIVSWWPGESSANDQIGANNGSLVNGVTFTNGEVGQAFWLNGSDYVSIPDAPSLRVFTNSITVELWMKSAITGNNPGWMWLVSKGAASWRVEGTSGTKTISFSANGLTSSPELTGTRNVNDGQWHHVAAVYDGVNKYLYIDGTLDASQPAGGNIAVETYPVEIGANAETVSAFQGAIDEVSIYHRALTAAEIQAIYLTGAGGKCPVFPPIILTQPASQSTYVGQQAVFSVAASGGAPLYYQWSFNATNIIGATNASVTLTNLQLTQNGSCSVQITNSYGATNSAAAVLTVNLFPPCAPVSSGMVSWWPGEFSANDIAGTNNGSLVGGVTFTNGEVGQAFWFNGGDYVSIPDAPSLRVFTNSITIELWMKSAIIGNNPGWMWLVSKGELSWRLEGTSGTKTISFSANGLTSAPEVTGTRNVNDGQWHHVAAVYDGTNKFLYIDGTLDASQAATGLIGFDSAPVEIGANAETTSAFQGALDEVSIYHRALSASEVQGIYLVGAEGKCPLPAPPIIVTQPVGQTNLVGQTASFQVVATGGLPLSYQWSVNTTNIAGATNATLVLFNLQTNESGNYSVQITNSNGATNSVNARLQVNPLPPCVSAPTNIVSWWPGESSANDQIGANNGSLVNGVTFTNGEVGQAFWLNGSDYVSIPDAPSLRVFTNSITVELWMKSAITGNNPGWMWLVSKGAASWRVEGTSGTKTISFSANGLTSSPELTGTRNVNDGQWHHVAAVYDGVNKYLYIDGTLDASQPAGGNIAVETYPVEIGANAETVSAFQGAIDEVSIYHRALTAAEIQSIYNAGAGGKCPVYNPPVVASQPTNETLKAGSTATFAVAITGTLPIACQWYFNDQNSPLVGATNVIFTLPNVQLTNSGIYFVIVTNVAGSTISSNALLTVFLQDHFGWSNLLSPRFVNVPFNAAIQALDVSNALVTNFTGTVTLSTTNGVPVNPPVSAAFVQGLWSGKLTIVQPVTNLVLRADDGLGNRGLANPVNVVYPPGLGTTVNGSSLLIYWPAALPAFTLETSSILNSPNWVTVVPGPVTIGGQNFVSLPISTTNNFYRLRYSGP